MRSETPGPSISRAWVMVPLLVILNVCSPGVKVIVGSEIVNSVSLTFTSLPLIEAPPIDVVAAADEAGEAAAPAGRAR